MASDAMDVTLESLSAKVKALKLAQFSLQLALSSLEVQTAYLSDIAFFAMKRDICLTASEVLKWSIGKKGEKVGETYQFTTRNFRTMMKIRCRSFGKFGLTPTSSNEDEYIQIATKIICDRNAMAHCSDLQTLEECVMSCVQGINRYPQLRQTFPDQCTILLRYHTYKTNMPDSFK